MEDVHTLLYMPVSTRNRRNRGVGNGFKGTEAPGR